MTPRQLNAFTVVAQTLSFTLACEQLHMSQPALSLAIRKLEESLGGRLLTRTTRQVRLTPEGAALLPQAVRLLASWNGLREFQKQRFSRQRQRVTVATMPSFAGNVLPAILRDYREHGSHAEITVQDVIHERVVELVEAGEVELGFCFEPDPSPRVVFEPMFVDRFVAVVPPHSELAERSAVSWAQLLEHSFITLQRPSSMRRLLERRVQSKGLQLQVAVECHQLATVGQLVAEGLGVSVVPSLCEKQMLSSGVRCLRLKEPIVRQAVGLITRRDQVLSDAAAAFRLQARKTSARG